MKVRHIAARNAELSRLRTIAYVAMFDWHPTLIEGGWDDESWDDDVDLHWDELYADSRDGDDEDDCDVDVCLGCGKYYGTHSGLSAWNRDDGVAPQLCHRCWKEHGYHYPVPA